MDEPWDHHVSPLMMGMTDLHHSEINSNELGLTQHSITQHNSINRPNSMGQSTTLVPSNAMGLSNTMGQSTSMGSSSGMGDLGHDDLGDDIGQHDGSDMGHHVGHSDGSLGGDYYTHHQLLVSGQQTTNSSSSPASGGGSLSPGGSGALPGALSPGGTSSTGPAQCCESGRPMITDPVTGQSVCSCQYDSARLAALQYPRSVGMYGTPYPSTDQNPYPSIGVDSSAFYSPLSNPYSLKDASGNDMSAWSTAGLQPTSGYYPYDPTLAAYGYGAGYDLAARRKNATRESTATLKAWLNEHKKNPYPTKGEKIMLAIITKMTLTQVSTWFANARRRLKKENKMTWEPKNKTDDDDDALVSDNDDKDKDDDDKRDDTDIHGRIKSERSKDLDDEIDEEDRKDDILGTNMHHILGNGYSLKPEMKTSECGVPLPPSKPKIWSLADTAACKTPPPPPPSQQQWLGSNNGFALPSSRYSSNGGFLPSHCQQGFPDVQTDTPPQTPPNMKLPNVTGNVVPGQGGPCIGNPLNNPLNNNNSGYSQSPSNFGLGSHFARMHSPQRPPQGPTGQMQGPGNENAAFKPFYKSSQSLNGGFVSPV